VALFRLGSAARVVEMAALGPRGLDLGGWGPTSQSLEPLPSPSLQSSLAPRDRHQGWPASAETGAQTTAVSP